MTTGRRKTDNTDHDLLITIHGSIVEAAKDIAEIKVQTQKTNGRVSSLEIWRGYITGAVAVMGAIVGYLVNLIK